MRLVTSFPCRLAAPLEITPESWTIFTIGYGPELLTHAHGVAYTQLRLGEFLDVQLPFLVLIQPVELRFHKLHPFLLADFAALVGIHEGQQLLDLILPECQFVLRFRNCLPLSGRNS